MARIHTVPRSSGADRAIHQVWTPRTELLSAALTRHRAERHDASDSWGDPKHWILLDDPLEVAQWRPAVDRKEWAGATCEIEISAQDRGAITGEVLHQGHVLAPAVQQNSMIVGAQVAHPVRLVAQHGHQG